MSVALGGILFLIYWKNWHHDKNTDVKTEQPFITTIVEKRIIPGNLYPLTEIEIKSPISGTLDKVFVAVGDEVKIGDEIAKIKIVPDPSKIEAARNNLNTAMFTLELYQKSFERSKKLFERGVIPASEWEEAKKNYEVSSEQYVSAKNQLSLIQEGYIKESDISNIVKASASGSIIDLPLKEGATIVERSTYGAGTSIATIARLDTFVFHGRVVESDMRHLHQGMKLTISFNAYEGETRKAVVGKISSKGSEEGGVMKYNIEARFGVGKNAKIIRSGYSANAEILLQQEKNVLAIKEKHLLFQNDSAYVNILPPDGKPQKRFVKTGLSDGVNIAIVDGLDKKSKVLTKEF